jgi:multidrug efflux pump subunit AcrA (membrane-fusion protein)
MVKLLTRRELWITVSFSALLWVVLSLAGANPLFCKAFPSLIMTLSVLTLSLDSDAPVSTKAEQEDNSTAEQQRRILEELAALRREIKSQPSLSASVSPTTEGKSDSSDKTADLSGALSEAMKQISVRDSQIDILATNVNRANIQRNLVRLTQILEVARSLKARVDSGLSNAKDSFDFLVDDMNSALTDQGVEAMEISVGARVSELPAGSFAAISVIDAPEDSLRGTVKEVRSRCYFIAEEGKKPRFIAAARVILYRA